VGTGGGGGERASGRTRGESEGGGSRAKRESRVEESEMQGVRGEGREEGWGGGERGQGVAK